MERHAGGSVVGRDDTGGVIAARQQVLRRGVPVRRRARLAGGQVERKKLMSPDQAPEL